MQTSLSQKFLRNANSSDFPTYMVSNPNFCVRTVENRFIQIKETAKVQRDLKMVNTKKLEDRRRQFVFDRYQMSKDSPFKSYLEQKPDVIVPAKSKKSPISVRESADLAEIRKIQAAHPELFYNQKWNRTFRNGELTKFLNSSKGVEDQKKVSVLFLSQQFSPISKTNMTKTMSSGMVTQSNGNYHSQQELDTMSNQKHVQFTFNNDQVQQYGSQSTKANAAQNVLYNDSRSPSFQNTHTTGFTQKTHNSQARSVLNSSLTAALRDSKHSEAGRQVKKHQVRENKKKGAQYIDVNVLDFYSNVNSRRQSQAYNVQEKIDSMRTALNRMNRRKSKLQSSPSNINDGLSSNDDYQVSDQQSNMMRTTSSTNGGFINSNLQQKKPLQTQLDDVFAQKNLQPIFMNPTVRNKFFSSVTSPFNGFQMFDNSNFSQFQHQKQKSKYRCPFLWDYHGLSSEDYLKTQPPMGSENSQSPGVQDEEMSESPRTDKFRATLKRFEQCQDDKDHTQILQICLYDISSLQQLIWYREGLQMLRIDKFQEEEKSSDLSVKFQLKMAEAQFSLGQSADCYQTLEQSLLPNLQKVLCPQLKEEGLFKAQLLRANCLLTMGDLKNAKLLLNELEQWWQIQCQSSYIDKADHNLMLQVAIFKYEVMIEEQVGESAFKFLQSSLQAFNKATFEYQEQAHLKLVHYQLKLFQTTTGSHPLKSDLDSSLSQSPLASLPHNYQIANQGQNKQTLGFNEPQQESSKSNQGLKQEVAFQYYELFKASRSESDVFKCMKYLSKAIEYDPDQWVYYFEMSLFLKQAYKHNSDALKYMTSAIRLNPQHSKVWYEAAKLSEEMNEYETALSYLQNAIDLDSENAEIYQKKAQILIILRRTDQAMQVLEDAVNMLCLKNNICLYQGEGNGFNYELPGITSFLNGVKTQSTKDNLSQLRQSLSVLLGTIAMIHLQNDSIQKAYDCLQQAIEYDNTILLNYINLAQLEFKVGNSQQCMAICDKVLESDYHNEKAYEVKGNVYQANGMLDQAFLYLSKAAQVNPESLSLNSSLAEIYRHKGKLKEAIAHYKKAQKLIYDLPGMFFTLQNAKQYTCDWEDYDQIFNHLYKLVQKQMEQGEVPNIDPFSLFMVNFTPEQKFEITKRYAEDTKQKALKILHAQGFQIPQYSFQRFSPLKNFPKIRLGYVSWDFADHPLSALMASVFSMHDRNQFVVIGISLRRSDGSEWRRRIEQGCDEFYDIPDWMTASDLADFIYRKNIHILFNLNGWTQGSRNDMFVLRPAPIQINYMGFCGSMGADYIDYIITDEISSPPDCMSRFYCEKAIYMPNSYFVNDYMQASPYCLIPPTVEGVQNKSLVFSTTNSSQNDLQSSQKKSSISNQSPTSNQNNTAIKSQLSSHDGQLSIKTNQMIQANQFPQTNKDDQASQFGLSQPPSFGQKLNHPSHQALQCYNNNPYAPVFTRRTTRQDHGLPTDKFIFANFNNLYKTDPTSFTVWMNVLKRVPDSIFWLLENPVEGKENLKREAQARGVDPDRIFFSEKAPRHIHIERCGLADLCLDNPITNGHTTNCDLLWSGLPVLTYSITENMPSRVGASLCVAHGCPEMITYSYKEYEELAVTLALGSKSLKQKSLGSLGVAQQRSDSFSSQSSQISTAVNSQASSIGKDASSPVMSQSRLKNSKGYVMGEGIDDSQIPDYNMMRPHGSLDLKRLRTKVERNRLTHPLFNTQLWVQHMEVGLIEAWRLYSQESRADHIFINQLLNKPSHHQQ